MSKLIGTIKSFEMTAEMKNLLLGSIKLWEIAEEREAIMRKYFTPKLPLIPYYGILYPKAI